MSDDPTRTTSGAFGDSTPSPSPEVPLRIGRYRILGVIGEGGMGTVYEAEQENPRRTVALKVIRPGLVTERLLRRFEQEAHLLGRLQHPGIAQVYEAGTADSGYGPQPYFAMELVRGRPLDQYAEGNKLNLRDRLELLARVCEAVHHAHQKGIVHRDLKPGNILVDEAGQPKVLDFGVARATDSDLQATMHTEVGTLIGTLPYMSPEQVGADPTELDTRSDVYALGVLLYELLSGRLPYELKGKTLPEAARIIREEDPSRLSVVSRTLRGDVETITAKALSKERERRYQSAAELAADLRRYLKDEPIVARPPSTAYQLRKFASRHKAVVGGLVAVFVVLAFGIVVSSWQAVRATRAESLATSRLAETQEARALAERKQQEAEERRAEAEVQRREADRARAAEAKQRLAAEGSAEQAKQEAAKAEAVSGFLREMLSSANPEKMKGRDVTVRQVLDEAAKRAGAGSLGSQFEIEASVRNTLGMTYRSLGLYPEAETQLRAALAAQKRASGHDDPAVATSLNNLALVLEQRGDLDGAEPLYRDALAIWRKAYGNENAEVATGLNNLGFLLQSRGDPAGAEPLLRESLAIRRRLYGPDHPDVAAVLDNLASVLTTRGHDAEAEPLYREALAIRRKALGHEHPVVAMSLDNLAELLRQRGDFAEAEPLYRESLEIGRKALGDEHPDVAVTLNNLALSLRARGDLAGAESLLRESLVIKRKTLGEDHSGVAASMINLASVLLDKGDPVAAEPLLRESVEIQKRALPARHTDFAWSLGGLGLCLIREGRYAEAEPVLREALSIREEKFPPTDWGRFVTESMLGEALAGQRKFESAEPLLLHGYEGMKDSAAAPALRKREAVKRLERLYELWDRPDKAAAWRAPDASPAP